MKDKKTTGDGPARPLRVLNVEDSARDAELVIREVERGGFDVTWRQVQNEADMKAALDSEPWDLVISDYRMPHFDGLQALRVLHETGIDIPFIIVSGTIGEETAVAAMKAGAHDYLMKGQLARLAPAVERELRDAAIRRDRKRVEETLRRNQAMLMRTESIAHVGSWEWDVATDTVTWSDELFRIFQRDPADGTPSFAEHSKLYYPEDMQRLRDAVDVAVSHGTPYELEMRAIRKDGATRVCLARGHAEMGPGGKAARLFGSLQDITERKRAEEEKQALLTTVEQEKMRLSALIEGISDEVWFADTQKTFTLANPSALREFGLARDETIDVEKLAKSLEVLRPDGSPRPVEEAPPLRALAGEVVRNQEEIVRTPVTGELRYRQVSSTPVKDPAGSIIGSVSVVRDITEHKRAEEELHHVLSSARCILWHSVVIPRVDGGMHWDIRISNEEAAEAMLPLTRKPGQSYSDVWQSGTLPEDRERIDRTSTQAIREGKPGYAQEYRCRKPNGQVIWLSEDARIRPLGPDRWLVVGVCTDITSRREAEEKTKQQLEELRRWHEVTLGREGRVAELKREVNELAARVGEKPKYGKTDGGG